MPTNNNDANEINLSDLGRLVTKTFYQFIYGIYSIFKFYWRHKFIVIALIAIGLALYWARKEFSEQKYESSVLVVQNFESVNYLYRTIDNIEAIKGTASGSGVMQKIFGPAYEKVVSLEIDPVNDFYNFDGVNTYNRADFESFTKSSDGAENLKDRLESIYFKYHRINFIIKDSTDTKSIISNFIDYVNSNEHYNRYAQIFRENLRENMKENQRSMQSIDSLIQSYIKQNEKVSSNLNITNNPELNGLYALKDKMLSENMHYQTKLVDFEQVIKPVSIDYNMPTQDILPRWLLYPLILVILFSLAHLVWYWVMKSKVYLEKEVDA